MIFSIITFGIYAIYWLVSTTNEAKDQGADAPNPWLLLLLLIPLVNLVVMLYCIWKYTHAIDKVSAIGLPAWLVFIFWFISPLNLVAMVMTQLALNKKAR